MTDDVLRFNIDDMVDYRVGVANWSARKGSTVGFFQETFRLALYIISLSLFFSFAVSITLEMMVVD